VAEVPKVYERFTKLFSSKASSRFPPSRPWDHALSISNQTCQTHYPVKSIPITQDEDKSLLKFLQEQEAKGIHLPVHFTICITCFSSYRRKMANCNQYRITRHINYITISNQYPLPLITDLLTDLSGAKIFTKLDVKDGYNNICIKEGDEHKAAFKTKSMIMGTTSHVLWTEKLTSYVPKYDELRIQRRH
jgi:hypothetical protein